MIFGLLLVVFFEAYNILKHISVVSLNCTIQIPLYFDNYPLAPLFRFATYEHSIAQVLA